ncbi:MAG TPA: HAMP domain-containing sensor histidine kinase [Acidimicrobiia bacterium]|nr:HAMP domain-containing sensor histidine kinase [Acidimicrobiia bacterium]
MRVTLAAAGLFAIALAGASFALVRTTHDSLTAGIERANQEQLEEAAQQLEQGVDPADVQVSNRRGGTPAFRVVGPGGRASAVPPPGTPGARPGPGDPQVRAQRRVETAQGTITLIAERSITEVDETVDSITDALLIGVPLLVLLVAGLTWWFAGRALRPVEVIRAEAAAITGSTIHRRVPEPTTDDEVGRLARTMNSMLDRLEETSLRQRRFVSDASHELRSPVAVIRTQLEVALRRGDDTDWPTVAHRVLAEDQRLEEAVSELLELARSDEGEEPRTTDVDLDEIVLEEVARPRRVPVDPSHVSAGRVHGNAAQLASVVRNLLDNACRHAASRVDIHVAVDGPEVMLIVDDDGPGVPLAERERIFERFTRLDEGRSRDAGGVGLGLAMVRGISERHGGHVEIRDAPIGGARFVVRLPAAA